MAKEKVVNENKKDLVNISSINYILYALIILFIYVFIVNAWVGDDAYITFRTVDNFINGYGLTWNTGERVQAYSHPLWMFIHSIFYFISGNIYYTTILLSFVFSFAAISLLMFKVADNKLSAIAGTVTLIMSKIFIDYTSSGLENPLTYFLIIIFLIFYLKDDEAKAKILKLSLITALAALNRMDTVLLFLPGLLYIVVKNRKAKNLLYVLYGFIPFIIWEIFSIIYYGFPLPNTYYAKLNTGIPIGEYISQGISYYANLFNNDPMSGVVIFGGMIGITIYSIKRKNANIYLPLVIGIFMYLLYILRIGGDFMSGRFFTGPLLMVVAILSSFKLEYKRKEFKYAIPLILIVMTGLSGFTSYHPVLTGVGFGSQNGKPLSDKQKDKTFRSPKGIVDERGIYYPDTGLWPLLQKGTSIPTIVLVGQAKETAKSNYKTIVRGMIGIYGFFAGPEVHIIDYFALGDPFLARLKTSKNPEWDYKWRIGHFYRSLPLGYIMTVKTGRNYIQDSSLAEYYNKLRLITQAELFSPGRFENIWDINTTVNNLILQNNYEANMQPSMFSGDMNSIMIFYLRLGNYYHKQKNFNKALQCYLKLIENNDWISKHDIKFYVFYTISQIYLDIKKFDSAEFYCRLGLSYVIDGKKQMRYALLLSKIYAKSDKLDESIKTLKEFLTIFPNVVPVMNELAILLALIGDEPVAIDTWKTILTINPELPEIYYNIFKYYYKTGNYNEAAYYAFKTIEKGGKVDQGILDFLMKYKK
ncbi:tetratricopeptide repeat protein [Bacteroidota bacterium]